MRLLLATNNPGKATEMRECLSGLPLRILTPADMDPDLEAPAESGSTFAENATRKARHYHVLTGLPTLADDSGIEVEALRGELGAHTRRWGAGPAATDEEWIAHFLRRMEQEEDRRARFVCHLAHYDTEGGLHMFEGVCQGAITTDLEAPYLPGLPISACFRPDGYDLVYSAMSIEQKNSTSHRGRALRDFRRFLEKRLQS